MKHALVLVALLLGCGDNIAPVGVPLEHADTVFVVGHSDDDLIFMQPALLDALERGSVATVYVSTGDPVEGLRHARDLQLAARVAYEKTVGVVDWDCGYVPVGDVSVYHCRATNDRLSIISLDICDGGIPGERRDSLLHLVDGTIETLPVLGALGGRVTRDSTIDLMAELLVTLAPEEIHALDLSGTHGRDHSSHLFSAAFTFWGAAKVGFAGPITWHRGYNVDVEEPTLAGARHDEAITMLGYYEACAYGCGSCGSSCRSFTSAHEVWLARQYASTRVVAAPARLATTDGCLTSELAIGSCEAAPAISFAQDGHLMIDGACLASTDDGGTTLEPCMPTAAQYWFVDNEGFVWNGAPPAPGGDMSYTHVRCLAGDGTATTPVCGDQRRATWMLMEPRTP